MVNREPNGQHSFYQLLHQGTNIVPLQFIGFKNSQLENDVTIQDSTSQQKLCANVAAQIVAFACGKDDNNPNKTFKGGRPSSIITGDKLTPKSLGCFAFILRIRLCSRDFYGISTASIRRAYSLERCLLRECWHTILMEHCRFIVRCLGFKRLCAIMAL